MPGRYEFSLPEAPIRDGWFRLGTLDVTTTAIYTGLAMISMLLYAISPEFVFKGAFVSDLVRSGEVWRLVTYPRQSALPLPETCLRCSSSTSC